MGGERVRVTIAEQLCHVRSSVLGRLVTRPLQVILPGMVVSLRVWVAAQVLNTLICGEGDQPLGDHIGECKLKSPTRMVRIVGSRSREVSIVRQVLSSTS